MISEETNILHYHPFIQIKSIYMFLNYIEEHHFQNEHQVFKKEALTSTFSVLMLENILFILL